MMVQASTRLWKLSQVTLSKYLREPMYATILNNFKAILSSKQPQTIIVAVNRHGPGHLHTPPFLLGSERAPLSVKAPRSPAARTCARPPSISRLTDDQQCCIFFH